MDVEGSKARVLREIDRRKDEAIGLLQHLVRTPTFNPPGNEKPLAEYCAAYLREAGLEVTQIEPVPLRVSNVGRLRGKRGSPVLLFNSHLDTFPPGDERIWKHPPFGAEIHDGILWGVGSKNMKAGLGAVMFMLRVLHDLGIELQGDLVVAQEADEIVLGDIGLRQLVERGLVKADFGVYTEADPPMKVEISHRGSIGVDVTTYGLAKHDKLKGKLTPDGPFVNAIAKMAKVIDAIENMEYTGWQPDPYIPGPPIASCNLIQGGQTRAMAAERCTVHVDCRILPCQTVAGVVRDVERTLDALRAQDPLLRVEAKVTKVALPSEISPDEPIVRGLQQAIREVTGLEMPVGGVSSTSDARWLVLVGKIPTAKFEFIGESESGPNEHIPIDAYLNTIRTYAVLALNMVGA